MLTSGLAYKNRSSIHHTIAGKVYPKKKNQSFSEHSHTASGQWVKFDGSQNISGTFTAKQHWSILMNY